MNTYKLKIRKGIDDLKSLFAFHGASQGDETRTNSIEAYEQSKGWLLFTFDCELTNEAIAAEVEKRKLWNEEYLKQLEKDGTFGEDVEHTINLQHNPAFDALINASDSPLNAALSSYSFIILDTETKNT